MSVRPYVRPSVRPYVRPLPIQTSHFGRILLPARACLFLSFFLYFFLFLFFPVLSSFPLLFSLSLFLVFVLFFFSLSLLLYFSLVFFFFVTLCFSFSPSLALTYRFDETGFLRSCDGHGPVSVSSGRMNANQCLQFASATINDRSPVRNIHTSVSIYWILKLRFLAELNKSKPYAHERGSKKV